MNKSSTVVSIPLYPGVKGNLLESPSTQMGTEITTKIHWVVPTEISWPDGWGIHNLVMVPKLAAYTGILEFKIYDSYQLAHAKYMGCVKINSEDDSYEVQMEQQYHRYRLTAMFTITHVAREPNEALAYRVGVPYGDWRYKDVI
jgi:hypothetical protein